MSRRAAQSDKELAATNPSADSRVFNASTVAALVNRFAEQLSHASEQHASGDGESLSLADLRKQDSAFDGWCTRRESELSSTASLQQIAESLLTDSSWRISNRSERRRTDPPLEESVAATLAMQDALVSVCDAFLRHCVKSATTISRDEAWRRTVYNFAYGLSHELNNPLANISTRAGVLLDRCDSQDDRELLSAIVDSAMRGCEMLGDLMLIARPPALVCASIETAEFITQFQRRVEHYAGCRGVTIQTTIAENAPPELHWDSNAMSEALWCLCRNSIECMPDGGEISVSLRGDSRPQLQIKGSQSDDESLPPKVIIEVSDNGPGLSDEAAEQCFDIFYSGRESGRGLGIGLAKSERIVGSHGGKISIGNRTSGGVSVIVLLPSRQPE